MREPSMYVNPNLWRSLNSIDEATFRAWAREHYRAGQSISPVWHPVVRDECRLINEEAKKGSTAS